MQMNDDRNRIMLLVKVNAFDREIQQMDSHRNDCVDRTNHSMVDVHLDFHRENKPIVMDLMDNEHYSENVHEIQFRFHH